MSEPSYVIAGNYQQYRVWLRGRNPQDFRYIHGADQLRGLRGGVLWTVGTWYEHEENHRALEIARAYGMQIQDGRGFLPQEQETGEKL